MGPAPALAAIAWLVIGGLTGSYTGKLSQVATNDSASFLPTSAESTLVQTEQKLFARSTALPAIVIAQRDFGVTAADKAFLQDAAQRFAKLPGVVTLPVGPATQGTPAAPGTPAPPVT